LRVLAVLIAAVALSACSLPVARAQQDSSADIDAYARSLIATGIAPSLSIAVVRGGRIAYLRSFGRRNLALHEPATPQTVYSIASLSKQFTAAALLMLVADGKVDRHAYLSRYAPEIPQSSKVTIDELVGMTSGYQDTDDEAADGAIPLPERFKHATERPLLFPPGTQFSYSNTNYELMALVVQKVSGMPFETFVRKRIVEPLHLTSWSLIGLKPLPSNNAVGYSFPTPVRGYPNPANGQLALLGGSGGMRLSVDDMILWNEDLARNHRVIGPEIWQAMSTSGTLRNGQRTGYGAGQFVGSFHGHLLISHGGDLSDTTTQNWIFPEDGTAITVYCNAGLAPVTELVGAIASIYFPARGTPQPPQTPPPGHLPPPALTAEARAWLHRALTGRETSAKYGRDFAATGRRYGTMHGFAPLAFQDRGTTLVAFFSVTLGNEPFTFYYDGTEKRGVALLPVWKPSL
jgi:D-alanyl-D-alanine carboxypeptidase